MTEHPGDLRPAIVTWIDTFDGPSGWHIFDEYEFNPAVATTMGWLSEKKSTKKYVTLFSTYIQFDEEFQVNNPMHIPRTCIRDIRYI